MSEETWGDHAAICPYCKYLNDPCDSEGELYDESTTTWECGECEREFAVSVYKSFTWTCRPMPEATT